MRCGLERTRLSASIISPHPYLGTSQLTTVKISLTRSQVGFGFMDNLVMIQAGDLIDNTIGVHFGLATLTAAAFGQVFRFVVAWC